MRVLSLGTREERVRLILSGFAHGFMLLDREGIRLVPSGEHIAVLREDMEYMLEEGLVELETMQ